MRSFERTGRSSGVSQPPVVAVGGSRRDGRYPRSALPEALSGVETAGGTTESLTLAEIDLPPLDPVVDMVNNGDVVKRTIRVADAILLGTPIYHGSYSGVMENALHSCGFDEFENTTVGLLVVSGGPVPTPALDRLRVVCRSLHAWVLPYQVAVPQARTVFDDDEFPDGDMRERVRALGIRIVEYAAIDPGNIRSGQCQEA